MGNVKGLVGIIGVSTKGQTLTLETDGLSDEDGLGTLTYQWIRGTTNDAVANENISGATSATYTLTSADVGKDISVKVSYTDDGGTAENITSSTVYVITSSTVYAASNAPTGVFTDSTQSLGSSSSSKIILGDLNNDGHLDMVVANASNGEDSKIWINDGTGTFTEKTETDLGSSQAIAVGDLDGDGDLDMFIGMFGAPDRIWENDGTGSFTVDDDLLGGNGNALNATLGDIDGDGDLDILVAEGVSTSLYTNSNGTFTDSNQDFYSEGDYIVGITLGDVNGDGYLDAIVASASSDNKILFNNAVIGGPGTFYNRESGDIGSRVRSIATGDIDGDGDLDIVTATSAANKVYFNNITQGNGTVNGEFTDSEQSLGSANSQDISLEDMDGDGDLDMVVANLGANKVYLNNGSGTFEDSGQSYESEQSNGIGIGDLDRDGDLDLVVANNFDYVDDSSKANKVYFNNSAPRGIIGIEGVSTAGQTLTAITDGLSDADGLGTLTYQWIRGTTDEGAVDVSI
ncbi:VCBS repeat-containing protein, partial [Paracoccaceae bacterium]|nr:VCBS repeat-containing protein [Paracoccaceae bacterium]